jgi:mono/diheme cytochrome c family protein
MTMRISQMSKFATLALAGALVAATAAGAQESDPLRKVATPVTRTAFPDLTTGEAVYKGVCQGCHMADAKGAAGAGAYPALASDERLATAEYPIFVVLKGQKAMPAFGGLFSDEQVAAVVGYIRTSFGNRYPAKVTPAAVADMRGAP